MKEKWVLALSTGLGTGLILWGFINPQTNWLLPKVPIFFWVWAPVVMTGVVIYADLVTKAKPKKWWRTALWVGLMTVFAILVPKFMWGVQASQYILLMQWQLPLLAWVGVGSYLLTTKSPHPDRVAVMVKSLEVMVVAGLILAAGGVFIATTQMLFQTVDIKLPEWFFRMAVAGGLSLAGILAAAIVYEPKWPPLKQNFTSGIYPIMVWIARLFIPFVIAVLAIYLAMAPVNFWVPFTKREALVTYNLVLAAVILLTIAATPIKKELIPNVVGKWIRVGIVIVSGLTVLVTLYAVAAAGYRMMIDQVTVNRIALIGWNLINLVVLATLLIKQVRAGDKWVERLQQTWGRAMIIWAGWVVGVIMILPWFFIKF